MAENGIMETTAIETLWTHLSDGTIGALNKRPLGFVLAILDDDIHITRPDHVVSWKCNVVFSGTSSVPF